MAEAETSTPESGPASGSESSSEAITLDGVLESVINGEFTPGESGPTPINPKTIAGETTSAEEVEVDTDPSDGTAEGQQEDVDAEATPEGDILESQEEPEPDALSAPKTWPAEHREAFAELPEEQQNFMLQREKERDAAFTRKTTDLAEQRRKFEGIEGVLAPYAEQMKSHGISEAEYVSRLMSYDHALRYNPQAAIQQLAQHYGIDLSNDSGADWSDDPDPQFQQLQQQLNSQNAEIQHFKQAQLDREHQQISGQVENFATETDTNGNLKHPHFEAVRERMGRLVNSGETTDLQVAYDMAVRLDDDLYKQTIQAERKAVAAQEEGRRKAAVDKAKKAAPGHTSGIPPSGSVKETDLDSILRARIGEATAS
jgi:hypothetical protein